MVYVLVLDVVWDKYFRHTIAGVLALAFASLFARVIRGLEYAYWKL